MRGADRSRLPLLVLGGVLFALLATANGAGYRYGVSDQAFYVPVVQRALNPAAFPRDAPLIDAQGELMLADEAIASVRRATGASSEAVFFVAYLLSLGLLWAGIIVIGHAVYRSTWAILALGAIVTLRHHIPETSANSLEPYFHPRVLAFAIGALALGAFLHRRRWLAVALVAAAAPVHVTTALWLGVLIGTALLVVDTRFRARAIVAGGTGLAIAAWVVGGALQGRFVFMDDLWLQAVASKELFPLDWPLWAWAANLGLLVVLAAASARRTRTGHERPDDRALAWGAAALVGLFLLTLPAVTAAQALLVQLQISRVFWIVEFVALVYIVAAVAEAVSGHPRVATVLVAVLVAVSTVRGIYIMRVEYPGRPLVAVALSPSPWQDAMNWLAAQPQDTHVLADPGHAWKYGTSVRVAAGRDVLLEAVKDSALAIYSRDVAARVVERSNAVGDFAALTPSRARALAERYDLDYFVTEVDLGLPVVHRNSQFRIYDIRPAPSPDTTSVSRGLRSTRPPSSAAGRGSGQ